MASQGNSVPVDQTSATGGDVFTTFTGESAANNQLIFNAAGPQIAAKLGSKDMDLKLTPRGVELLGSNGEVQSFDRISRGEISITSSSEVGSVAATITLTPQVLAPSDVRMNYMFWRLELLVIDLLCFAPLGTSSGAVYACYTADPEMGWPTTAVDGEKAALRLTATRFIMARNGLSAIIPSTSEPRYVKAAGTKRLERYGTFRIVVAAKASGGTSTDFKLFSTAVLKFITPALQVLTTTQESTVPSSQYLTGDAQLSKINNSATLYLILKIKDGLVIPEGAQVSTLPNAYCQVSYTVVVGDCTTTYNESISISDFTVQTFDNGDATHSTFLVANTDLSERVPTCTDISIAFTQPAFLIIRAEVMPTFADFPYVEPFMFKRIPVGSHQKADIQAKLTKNSFYNMDQQAFLRKLRSFLHQITPALPIQVKDE